MSWHFDIGLVGFKRIFQVILTSFPFWFNLCARASQAAVPEGVILGLSPRSMAHFSSLLSVEPVLAFQKELVSISTLAYNFSSINYTICTFLSKDTHADNLRVLLESFNGHAFEVANYFHTALMRGIWFYVHDEAEFKALNISDVIDDEREQKLLDPEFQRNAKELALNAAGNPPASCLYRKCFLVARI